MKKLLICLSVAFLCFPPAAGFAAPCPPNLVKCGKYCVDLNTDSYNCGDCGFVCPSGECNAGSCDQVTVTDVWTYDLARLLTGEGYSDNNYDFGTFSIADQDTSLRITVNLNPESIYVFDETHVKTIAFNYVEGSVFSTYTYTVNIMPTSVLNDEDNVKMGGYKSQFDLKVPDEGKIHPKYTEDYQITFTITAVNKFGVTIDLNPEDLINFADGDVIMALQLGGLETNIDGSDSAWIPFIDDDNIASPS
jgi:hypothetical protein